MGVHPLSSPAVFLDRDGVLNESPVGPDGIPRPPASAREIVVLPNVRKAIEKLRRLGFVLVVVTNQPDIARGAASADGVAAINARVRSEIGLEHFFVCPHDDGDACDCRKPSPGLLIAAARALDIDLGRSYIVGDRWRDIEAGHRAGCTAILVDNGYSGVLLSQPEHVCASLWEAALQIEGRQRTVGAR